MTETKQVRAIELGFYQGGMIKEGTVFTVPSSFKAKWVVDADAPEVKKEQPKEPETLSELGKRSRKTNAEYMQGK